MSVTQTILSAQIRSPEQRGKGFNRRLRAAGRVPAVIYGKDETPVSLDIEPRALRRALNTPHKLNTVITVRFDGDDSAKDRLVLLKETQQHPVTGQLVHVDFQQVHLDTRVYVSVPVVLKGRARGVIDGGLLTHINRSVELVCTAGRIPAQIELDVTKLRIGENIHESDLQLPEGVELSDPSLNLTIASIVAQDSGTGEEAGNAAG